MPMGRQSTVMARKQHPLSVWSSHKAKHPQIHWRRGQGKFTQQRRFTLCYFPALQRPKQAESTSIISFSIPAEMTAVHMGASL